MLPNNNEIMKGVMLADDKFTTCAVKFSSSDKSYTYRVHRDIAQNLKVDDYVIVDHNNQNGYYMCKVAEVHDEPAIEWGNRTRTVLMKVSREALERRKETVNNYFSNLASKAKHHLTGKVRQAARDAFGLDKDDFV